MALCSVRQSSWTFVCVGVKHRVKAVRLCLFLHVNVRWGVGYHRWTCLGLPVKAAR
jgi:hypothetical protein